VLSTTQNEMEGRMAEGRKGRRAVGRKGQKAGSKEGATPFDYAMSGGPGGGPAGLLLPHSLPPSYQQ
jgi:hypothetical protein